MNKELSAHTTLSHYRIVAKLGAGGMGEVYLAQGSRLDRNVAIKVLPSQFTRDESRLRRFVQEARAASSLNHPNIITIHEIGESDDIHYIATEFVDGQTLRKAIASGKMELLAVLRVSIQVASALVAAHEAGIIHRDVKPENIMLRRDGYVKVLDFGLAKLTEPQAPSPDTEAPTIARFESDPGTILGTAAYMSPEQARGLKVDSRTDIFSLGVVLYEMVTGRAPFEGESKIDVLAAIIDKEPTPISRHLPGVPAELQRIVTKALRKDREERYQTVKDLMIDLKSLKQELEAEARMAGLAAGLDVGPGVTAGSGAAAVVTAASSNADTAHARAVRTTSSAEVILSEIKRHKRGALLVLGALAVVTAGAAFGLYKLISQNRSKLEAPLQGAKITAITTHGRAGAVAISPDGKYVAYTVDEDGKQSLWLRQVAISSSAPILPPVAETYYSALTFSRDGNFLYYILWSRDPAVSGLYQMTSLGRNQRRLMAGRFFGVTLSPDGTRIALVHRDVAQEASRLVVANADGSNEQTLARRQRLRLFLGPPAWSPDGRIIACLSVELGLRPDLTGVSVEGGEEKPLFAHPLNLVITSFAWLPDGGGLIVSASEALEGNSQLWQISYPGGEKRRITNDLNDYDDISVTADSSALVTMQRSISSSLWIVPKGDASGATQIPYRTGKDDGQEGVAWTRDGKILFTSTASGSSDLWIMDADGSNQKQ